MEEWVWWMIAAGGLAVGEIFTMGFFLGPVAIAAVLSAIVALLGGGLAVTNAALFMITAVAVIVGGLLLATRNRAVVPGRARAARGCRSGPAGRRRPCRPSCARGPPRSGDGALPTRTGDAFVPHG